MNQQLVIAVVIFSSFLIVCQSKKGKDNSCSEGYCDFQLPPCGLCGSKINVTLKAINSLQTPYFSLVANLVNVYQRELLALLELAANMSPNFKFQATYFPGNGYFIDSINNLAGSTVTQTYWKIIAEGDLDCGVYNYIPANGEEIIFKFSSYASSG